MNGSARVAGRLVCTLLAVFGLVGTAQAINLEYAAHAPAYGVGYEHILTVDPAPPTLIDGGGSTTLVTDFNFWRPTPPSLATLEAHTSMSSDVPDPNVGPSDEFHVFSPFTGGIFKLEGKNFPGGGIYNGENSAFTGEGLGSGAFTSTKTIWDIEIVSTGEALGTPVKVDVYGIIQGYVFANKVTDPFEYDARATWDVKAEGISVISGFVGLLDGPGTIPFSDDNLLSPVTFYKAVGDTFTLEIDYKLEVDGTMALANSIAEVTGSEVAVYATVVPEPSTWLLLLSGVGWSFVATRSRRNLRR